MRTNDTDHPDLAVLLSGTGTPRAPLITCQPADFTATSGESATLSLALDGTPPFNCQWYKDDQPLTESARTVGATSPTLIFQPAQPGDAGRYYCHVSSPYGTINSSTVRLQVKPVLCVQSDFGAPSPSIGRHAYPAGIQLMASVGNEVVEPDGRTRHSPTGWRCAGALPAEGQGTNVTLQWVVGAPASIHWQLNAAVADTAVRFELWHAGVRVATLAETGYNDTGEDTTAVQVPAVPPAGDYRLRVISTWLNSQKDPDAWAESVGLLTIDKP